MKVHGHNAAFKDGILAVERQVHLKDEITIDDVKYRIKKEERSTWNKHVWLYYLEEKDG